MRRWSNEKDLTRHMEEGAQKHLTVIASKYLKTQADVHERITKLERENEDLKRENEGLKKSLAEKHCAPKATAMKSNFCSTTVSLTLSRQHFSNK